LSYFHYSRLLRARLVHEETIDVPRDKVPEERETRVKKRNGRFGGNGNANATGARNMSLIPIEPSALHKTSNRFCSSLRSILSPSYLEKANFN